MILGQIGNRHLTGIIFRDSKVTSWKVGGLQKTSENVQKTSEGVHFLLVANYPN